MRTSLEGAGDGTVYIDERADSGPLAD